MSLSDLHNPKAAAEFIERFRKRFNTKVCMAPMSDHEPSIVSAHTLSVESMLRVIAVDGHVYAPGQSKRIAKDAFPIEIQRKGIRDVSVFNGFCSRHDRELFMCLDTDLFRFTRQQLFMLAYRATARECYLITPANKTRKYIILRVWKKSILEKSLTGSALYCANR